MLAIVIDIGSLQQATKSIRFKQVGLYGGVVCVVEVLSVYRSFSIFNSQGFNNTPDSVGDLQDWIKRNELCNYVLHATFAY